MDLNRLGRRYQVIEDLGEMCTIIFAIFKKDQLEGNPEKWAKRSHAKCDGIGAITDILEKEGIKVSSHPTIRQNKPPYLLKQLYYFYRYCIHCSGGLASWKKRPDWSLVAHPKYAYYNFFTKEQSDQIKKYAKQYNISTSAFFLALLDRVSSKYLLNEKSDRKWLVPINMRGAYGDPLDKRNIVATIILKLSGENKNDAPSIHQQLKSYLQQNLHWGSWISAVLQSFVGPKKMMALANKYPNSLYALFSNMGSWPSEYIEGDCPLHLALMPVTTRVAPLGVCMLEFYGQYQFSLMLHPCLGLPDELAKTILQDFATECLKASEQELNAEDIRAVEIKHALEQGSAHG